MRYSPPAERHERHESTPDPAKHETNLGVGWTPPVFPSGDTNTMMKLKDWLSFTLNYVIWIGYHKFLPVARLRSENASDRSQTGNSPRKTEWSCSCQEDRNGSSSSWTAQLLCGYQLPQDLAQPGNTTSSITPKADAAVQPLLMGGRPWRTRLCSCNSCWNASFSLIKMNYEVPA